MDEALIRLGYRELAERYDLGGLKRGGDFQLMADGNVKLTRDFDWQLGDDTHSALHRLAIRWRFNARMLNVMFDQVEGSTQRLAAYREEQEQLATRRIRRSQSDQRTEDSERWAALDDLIGEEVFAPQAYSGTILVLLHAMLRREWGDLRSDENRWQVSGDRIAGYSFGVIVEAGANNFRHFDEWASTADATSQQLKSMVVLSAALGVPMAASGVRHPFRRNVCPDIIRCLSDGSFAMLMDRFFAYARSLTDLA